MILEPWETNCLCAESPGSFSKASSCHHMRFLPVTLHSTQKAKLVQAFQMVTLSLNSPRTYLDVEHDNVLISGV